MSDRCCIVLFNHASGSGHHESWTALFAKLLLGKGYRVVCMTPDKDKLYRALAMQDVAGHPDLALLESPAPLPPPRILRILRAAKARLKPQRPQNQTASSGTAATPAAPPRLTLRQTWRILAYRYVQDTHEAKITPDMPPVLQWKKRCLRLVVPPAWHSTQAAKHYLKAIRARCRLWRTYRAGFRHPRDLVNVSRTAMEQSPWQPELLFAMYLDIWRTGGAAWRMSGPLALPWSGIRFIPFPPEFAGQESYCAQSGFKGMCFLDEQAAGIYTRACPHKTFSTLPDITNVALPEQPSALAEAILAEARGRKIVLLCGSIEGRKNVGAFCRTALRADPEDWFFALVGEHHPHSFSAEDTDALARLAGSDLGHAFLYDGFLDDERELNAVIAAADVLFAVYRDFTISSNMPTKAAYFEKPILAAKGYLMGNRIERYTIGRTVDQDDENAMLAALNNMLKNPVSRASFASYRQDFSEQRLADALDGFVRQCMHATGTKGENS